MTGSSWNGWDTIDSRLEAREWRRRRELDRAGASSSDEVEAALEGEPVELPASLVAEALVHELQPNPYGRSLPTFDEAA